MDTPAAALAFFLPGETSCRLTPLGQGNINDTWKVERENGPTVVLQRLHPSVFPDPGAVMHNMRVVTGHLSRKASAGMPLFFRLLADPQGRDSFLDGSGHCWRLLSYIAHTRTLAHLATPQQAEEIGGLLGRFHLLVADIDPDGLADPLPDFHITPRYLQQFDALGGTTRAENDQETFCRTVIETERSTADVLEQVRDELTRQVIHGDPKTANFFFAAGEDRAVSLIDFDTVKPGLLLHDLADCLRSCCNLQGEAHQDPAGTFFDPDFFQALLRGYLRQAGHLLTPSDQALLVRAVQLISFELGLRFFTDHLNGDQYFKVSRPGQNLHRALIQFHLHRSIRAQQRDLEQQLRTLARVG